MKATKTKLLVESDDGVLMRVLTRPTWSSCMRATLSLKAYSSLFVSQRPNVSDKIAISTLSITIRSKRVAMEKMMSPN
jgi:hypothetical protein